MTREESYKISDIAKKVAQKLDLFAAKSGEEEFYVDDYEFDFDWAHGSHSASITVSTWDYQYTEAVCLLVDRELGKELKDLTEADIEKLRANKYLESNFESWLVACYQDEIEGNIRDSIDYDTENVYFDKGYELDGGQYWKDRL